MTSRGSLSVGTRVITYDGVELGPISEVQGDCFRVDVPLGEDRWFGPDAIAINNLSDIRLKWTRNQLDEQPKAAGAHAGFHRH
jgi:hypothetical protein